MGKSFNFSTNWNSKLNNNSYTTLRMSGRIEIGETISVSLKKEFLHFAKCIDKKRIKVKSINEFIAQIDTGYSRKECIGVLKRMYPKLKNIEEHYIYLYLLKRRK